MKGKSVFASTGLPTLITITRLEKAYWLQRDPDLLRDVDVWLDGEVQSGAWKETLDTALAAP